MPTWIDFCGIWLIISVLSLVGIIVIFEISSDYEQ